MQVERQPVHKDQGPSGCLYTFKTGAHSSHSLILGLLPERGEGHSVLDLGCGPGYLSCRLAGRGFRVVAVDRVPPEERAAGVKFLPANLNVEEPRLEERFDYALMADVLEHLLDPERLVAWAVARLKAQGRLVISVPNVAHLYVRLKLLAGNFDYAPRGILDRTHLRFFTRKTFLRFLRDCGLRCLELRTTPAPLELLVREERQEAWFHALQSLHAAAARLFPRLLAYQFVCLAAPGGEKRSSDSLAPEGSS